MCLSEMEVAASAGATRGQCEHIAGPPCYILRPGPDSPHWKPAHPEEGTAPTCWPVVGLQFRFQFSRSVVSDSSRPQGLQHARPPCPSPTPRVYPNPCPLSRGCHPAISSSVVPFSSRLQSFRTAGYFHSLSVLFCIFHIFYH